MEGKRRLPSWIVRASTTDNVSKPLDMNENDVITKEEVTVVAESRKPKAKGPTGKHKKEACLPSDEKSVLVKCQTKRKKGGFVEKDLIEYHDREKEVVVEKRKRGRVARKVEEPDSFRKKGEKNELETSNENQASSRDEEDEDLTMEDMLSFAREFVENDTSDMVQQERLEDECKLQSKSSHISSSMTGTSLSVPQVTTSPMHEETASDHDIIENTTKVTTTTGDAAQDMLDLFLGPLLKKPIAKDVSSINNIILPHEVKNQQPDTVISNKPITFTKKKSSLRDAVAMFLD